MKCNLSVAYCVRHYSLKKKPAHSPHDGAVWVGQLFFIEKLLPIGQQGGVTMHRLLEKSPAVMFPMCYWQASYASAGSYFRFSAKSSAICWTLSFPPRFSAPPRSCRIQPGQSVTRRCASVASNWFNFLSSCAAEILGNLTE